MIERERLPEAVDPGRCLVASFNVTRAIYVEPAMLHPYIRTQLLTVAGIRGVSVDLRRPEFVAWDHERLRALGVPEELVRRNAVGVIAWAPIPAVWP